MATGGEGFFQSYFNDLLLIPCALPLLLWLHASFGWRHQDEAPNGSEVIGHWAIWSIVAEWIGPRLFTQAVGDWRDVMAYGIGAAFAWCWWHRERVAVVMRPFVFVLDERRKGENHA